MKKALWTTLPNAVVKAECKRLVWIPRRTPQRAKEERKYIALVMVWIRRRENEFCRGCRLIFDRPANRATECHHWAGRRGVLLLYMPWWIPLCDVCHRWVTANARAASWLNLICPPGNYNDPPPAEALAAFERNQHRNTTNEQSR